MKLANVSPTFIEYHALRGTYGRVTYFVTKTSLRDAAEKLDPSTTRYPFVQSENPKSGVI